MIDQEDDDTMNENDNNEIDQDDGAVNQEVEDQKTYT